MKTRDGVEIHGHVEPGFGPTADAFVENFEERNELGASFALYVGGEKVVDIHAGKADRGSDWTADSVAVVFSTTKGMTAICVAMLVERGLVSYDDPVSKHWPEFAANGKESVTVAQMMSHQAGLIATDQKFVIDDVLAGEPVVRALAEQTPLWEPGTAHGYHALTYGWLAGELIRRLDGRSVGRFLAEDVAGPLDLDMWIGLPESEEPRVAKLRGAPRPEGEDLELMKRIAGRGTNGDRALTLDGALAIAGEGMPFNTRAVHAAELPAANGITNAASVAKLYAATLGEVDGVRLTNDSTVDEMRTEQVNDDDLCLVLPTRFGQGFMLNAEFLPMYSDDSFGHYGAGGSLGFADVEAGFGFGYVMNQMGGGIAGDPRAVALIEATRLCL